MRRSFLALSLLFASALDALSAVPARAQAQVQDPSAVAWYAEAGAFAELGDDRDPLAGDAARRTTGLGAELRLGRPLAGFLDADAGLRLGGDVLRAGYVFGADLGVRVHPATFVAPFLGTAARLHPHRRLLRRRGGARRGGRDGSHHAGRPPPEARARSGHRSHGPPARAARRGAWTTGS
jgi:hypothetical protein